MPEDDARFPSRTGRFACKRPILVTSAGRSSWTTKGDWRTMSTATRPAIRGAAQGSRAAAGHRCLRAMRPADEPALHRTRRRLSRLHMPCRSRSGRGTALPGGARAAGRCQGRKRILLEALTPDRIAIAIAALGQIEEETRQLERQWALRRERARYEAERARRQYDAVEPENRLVARSLERVWEEKLRAAEAIEQDYERWRADEPLVLSEADRAGAADAWARTCRASGMLHRRQRPNERASCVSSSARSSSTRSACQGQVWFKILWQSGATSEHSLQRRVHTYGDYIDLEQTAAACDGAQRRGQDGQGNRCDAERGRLPSGTRLARSEATMSGCCASAGAFPPSR